MPKLNLSLSLGRDRSGLDNALPLQNERERDLGSTIFHHEIKRKRDAYLSSSLFTFRPHFFRRRANGRVSFDGLDSSSRGDFRACEGRRQHGDDYDFCVEEQTKQKHLHKPKRHPNIQFRVLDTLEEQSLWKKRRKTPV